MSAATKFKVGDKVMLSPTFYRDLIMGSRDTTPWGPESLRKIAAAGGVATVTSEGDSEYTLDVAEYTWHHTWLMHVPTEDTPVLESNPFEFGFGDRIDDGAGNTGTVVAMGVYSDGVPVYILTDGYHCVDTEVHGHSGNLSVLVASAEDIRRLDA